VCRLGRPAKLLLFEQRLFTISSGSWLGGYEVVVCRDCGFCSAENIPDQTVFDNYYKEIPKYEYQDRDGEESDYDLGRFRKIVPPSDLPYFPEYAILISSRAFQQEIFRNIKEKLGLKNEIILLYNLKGPH
jgi:hypothetical protein